MSLKKESPSDIQLHLAALHGDEQRIRRLLDTGKIHVDSRDKDGTTPLILAAASGNVSCVRELLDQGADPRARRVTGTTALFFAAQGGFLDIAQILLDSGAPVDSPSVDGGTPLFVACQCGHMDVVQELVKRGAKVNTHMKDRATPLFIAAQNGHLKVLLFLLTQGAQADPRRTDGATPLWIAAQMGHDHIVKQLLKAGANVDATRHDGATALFKAAHKGHAAVIEELLKFKPNLGLLPNGETALHAAALFGHLPIVKQLMSVGADPTLHNQEGATPLQLARDAKHTAVVEYLYNAQRDKGDLAISVQFTPWSNRVSTMPIRDRLPELRAFLQWNSKPEPVIVLLGENLQDINAYLSEVEMVREMLNTIKTNTSEIRKLYSIMLSVPGGHHEANSEVLTRREIVEKSIRNAQNKLKSLESSVDENSAPTLYRIQCIQNAAHIRMFKEVTENYHQVLLSYRDRCTALIKRQLMISNRNEELEELLEKDSAIFVDNIIADTLEAQLQLNAVKRRHEDLRKIEDSIREMRDMFVNLAILVEQQGEQLNCIRYLVEHAEGYTDHGRARLEKAKRRAKKRKRRCRKIKITIAIIVIILVLIILGQLV